MARSASPARASASASAIFNSPSKNRTFCWRSCSTPRRMSLEPVAKPCRVAAVAKPSRNDAERSPQRQLMLTREASELQNAFCAARALSPRINSNMAACSFA